MTVSCAENVKEILARENLLSDFAKWMKMGSQSFLEKAQYKSKCSMHSKKRHLNLEVGQLANKCVKILHISETSLNFFFVG